MIFRYYWLGPQCFLGTKSFNTGLKCLVCFCKKDAVGLHSIGALILLIYLSPEPLKIQITHDAD